MMAVGSPLAGKAVLVVEDSAVQRGHAVSLVRCLGAEAVLEAADGVDALAQLALHPGVDLVLTDLDMPHMDGVCFIGELAARGLRPDVIVTSAQESGVLHAVHLMAEAWGLSVPGVLPKPLGLDALERLLAARPLPFQSRPAEAAEEATAEEIADGLRAGEFLCHYQPQVTLQGALLKGVEALARWSRPGRSVLGPATFLPVLEASEELMAAFTFVILGEAARTWHTWRSRGLNLEISINLSARSISCKGFADQLMAEVDRLDVPPRTLVFELTESASVSNLGHTLSNLARLRMRGFKLSIDDFGTGFATFEQLERIPFTELKLDRSIVKDLPASRRHWVLAQSLLQMSQGLRLGTVAEGIETLEAWHALRELGCERGQGYLIARPMPAGQLLDWAHQDRAMLRV